MNAFQTVRPVWSEKQEKQTTPQTPFTSVRPAGLEKPTRLNMNGKLLDVRGRPQVTLEGRKLVGLVIENSEVGRRSNERRWAMSQASI